MGKKWTAGFDPGKETGFALFHGAELMMTESIEGGFVGFRDWWTGHIDYPLDQVDEFVVERYVPVEGFRGMDQTHSLEIQGAIRMVAGAKITLQLRSDKSTLFNQVFEGDRGRQEREAWFKERGLSFATTHELDAATHVLVSQKRNREFWRRYWA